MRLKSFYAKTMTEAMQMVRDTLGEDAIIVATREEQGGKAVRVTAAIEPGYHADEDRRAPAFEVGEEQRPPRKERNDWLQYDDEDEESAVTEDITDAMLRHGVSEDVMDQIISCATVIGFEQPGVALVAAIEHLFHFDPLPVKKLKKALMMIGPPGAGKTLAVAKIATRAVMNDLRVGVITTDTVRAGGVEQLAAFTKLLKVPLRKAADAQELGALVRELSASCDQVLIDMPGVNPFARDDIKTIAKMVGAAPVHPILVMPAGMDTDECGEMARAFAAIGAQSILSTRIDMARRLGGLLSAAHHGGLSFTDASNTPKIADGLMALTPKTLSALLMPGAYRTKNEDSGHAKAAQSPVKSDPLQPRKRLKQ